MSRPREHEPSRWPHRLVIVLALVTFPLIWVGGLVTTYDAGMAVPDWPGTYGYNLLLYPWQSWLAGPFDLFIEHGHRLLGAAAGLLAICLVAVVIATRDRRAWLRWAAAGALVLVVLQGVLGGARVLLDARLVALVHGCIGPLFFAYLAALAVATSRWWSDFSLVGSYRDDSGPLFRASWTTAALAYAQLVVGAIVRHVPLSASPQVFRAALVVHLVLAAVLVVQIVALAVQFMKREPAIRFRLLASLLLALVGLQVALGGATYVAKYAWPAWMGEWQFAASYIVEEKGLWQALVTTGHVANGSLILFVAVTLAMRMTRVLRGAGVSPALDKAGETPAPLRRAIA